MAGIPEDYGYGYELPETSSPGAYDRPGLRGAINQPNQSSSMLGTLGTIGGAALGGPFGAMAGGTLGTSLGQAFMGDSEESALNKRQAEQQFQETATYKGAQQPTIMLANYLARDQMMQQSGMGDMARLLNTADFAMNQVIPYLQASSAQGGERRQNPNAAQVLSDRQLRV
jgi:hypothetical protein